MSTGDDVSAVHEALSSALAAQDVDRVVALYTEDARLLFNGRPMIKGRVAIDAYVRPDLGAAPMILTLESVEILEGGGLVVDIGRLTTRNGVAKYVIVHERQVDGSLWIAVDTVTNSGSS